MPDFPPTTVRRSPFVVCACWYKHPKHGRHFIVGTQLLDVTRPEMDAMENYDGMKEPKPDEIFVRKTAFYD